MPSAPNNAGERSVNEESWCDWCGEAFADGETPVEGYENEPTHRKCQREARRAWRADNANMIEYVREREPFIDWPNGQGTDD